MRKKKEGKREGRKEGRKGGREGGRERGRNELSSSQFKSPPEPIIYTRHLDITGPLGIFALSFRHLSSPCFFQRWCLGHRKMSTSSLGLGGRRPRRRAVSSFVVD